MNSTICSPDHSPLIAGEIIDLPKSLAQKVLNAKDAASRDGHEIPAATLVTDPRERAIAKQYRPPAVDESELTAPNREGWLASEDK